MKVYEIPESGRTARGTAIVNLLQLMPGEKITAAIPFREYEENKYLFMATKKGIIKKTPIYDYINIRKSGLQAINLRDDDELIEVKITDGEKDIIMVTKHGQCIRFHENDVRITGRTTMGVIGMNLTYDDEVVAMQLNTQGSYLILVSEYGMGKCTNIAEFTAQHRGGKGIKCYKVTERTGNVVAAKIVNSDSELMIITTEGTIIQIMVDEVSILGRITSGVKLIDLDPKKEVVVASITKVRNTNDTEPAEEPKEDQTDIEK